jgi:hypothetical protein
VIAMPMDAKDEEELRVRRMTDAVTNSVDAQIKRRYFLAALLFGAVSWFGGSALITYWVEHEMKPVNEALIGAQTLLDQAKKREEELETKLTAVSSEEKTLESAQSTLKSTQKDVKSAFDDINSRLQILGAGMPLVIVHLAGSTPQLGEKLRAALCNNGKNIVTIEIGGSQMMGISTVQYFYSDDKDLADQVRQFAVNVLHGEGLEISQNGIPVADLTGKPVKPTKHSIDVFLNLSDGELR